MFILFKYLYKHVCFRNYNYVQLLLVIIIFCILFVSLDIEIDNTKLYSMRIINKQIRMTLSRGV